MAPPEVERNGQAEVERQIEDAERVLRAARARRENGERTLQQTRKALEEARRKLREAGYLKDSAS
jgi:hypothetical protein